MSWTTCLDSYKSEPGLGRSFAKIQDYLSCRTTNEVFLSENLNGIKVSNADLKEILATLEENKVIERCDTINCPTYGCGEEASGDGEDLICSFCMETFKLDEADVKEAFRINEVPARSSDTIWASQFQKEFKFIGTNRSIFGIRDGDAIVLAQDITGEIQAGNAIIEDQGEIIKLIDCEFQIEYGNQKRGFICNFEIISKGHPMYQVNVSGNATVGNIQQGNSNTNNASNIPESAFLSLIAEISKATDSANENNKDLLELLAKASSSKGIDKAAILMKMLEFGTKYAPIILPFVPQITALLGTSK